MLQTKTSTPKPNFGLGSSRRLRCCHSIIRGLELRVNLPKTSIGRAIDPSVTLYLVDSLTGELVKRHTQHPTTPNLEPFYRETQTGEGVF